MMFGFEFLLHKLNRAQYVRERDYQIFHIKRKHLVYLLEESKFLWCLRTASGSSVVCFTANTKF